MGIDEINRLYFKQRRTEFRPERNAMFLLPRKTIPIAQFHIASHRIKPEVITFL
jgi:hypothetical protein